MPNGAGRDPRRWIRHFRDLKNLRAIFPTGSADPRSPAIISPWLADTVQPVFPLTPDFRVFPVAQPAAGANFTLQVPDDVIFRILSFRALFTSDANAANRVIQIQVTSNAGQILLQSKAVPLHVASVARSYTIGAFGADLGANGSVIPILVPPDLWLRSGFTLSSIIQSIQVGDQWSALTAQVEAWPNI